MKEKIYEVCVAQLSDNTIIFKIKDLGVIDEGRSCIINIKEPNYENILGDLLNDKEKFYESNDISFNKIEEKDYCSKYIINSTCKELEEYLSYMKEEKIFTLEFFERFKMFKNIVFSYKIYQIDKNANSSNINENIKAAELIPSNDTNRGYVYTCKGIKEIVFSILHSYIINRYKLSRCEHCEKWFATKTYKKRYCNRKSPFKKCEHLDCEQAVRNLRQSLARKYKRRKTALEYRLDLNKITEEEYEDWLKRANVLRDKMYEQSSVKNINIYDNFLDNKEV